ncbi:MAG: M3 family oligoendopeptidase [Faecalibacterium sp.]|jgi:M3 family oligoendopeptidase|nr:M3 family oligoendopeptidase [Faecalibacterium sp.]
MKFEQMEYTRPDLKKALAELAALEQRAETADSDEAMIQLFWKLDRAESAWATMEQLASIHYTLDTRDEKWGAEREFFDANTPAFSNAEVKVYRSLLQNPFVHALDKTFGPVVTPGMKNAVLSLDDRVLPLKQEDNALVSAYQKLYGSAMVDFDGKTLTLPKLGAYKESLNRATRRAAYEAEGGYFDAHREEFDTLYTKMVENRNRQAQTLGYHDYSELSYHRMNRLGYGPKEVQAYRDEVKKAIVPKCSELMRLRRQRAGLPADAKFYDGPIAFADGNPKPHGTKEELMANCRRMYQELSPETGEFIAFMQDNGLFDVDSRPGKAPGGYCELITNYAAPFIFANWNGTSADVDVLTHEAGHAFEWYLASRDETLPKGMTAPGMESCEIHSMSMEFLTAPWHELFFGPDTAKYELAHAEDAFFFLPYGCVVDEFQHIMYQKPELTPDERNEVWLSLEKEYRPWIDFDGLPFYGRGAGWQRQLHIYECPFYYIDYCLAQTIALQFFAAHLADPKDAWARYMKLVRRAGREPYAGLVAAAGMQAPFTPGSLTAVADTVASWIEKHQKV